MKKAIIVLVVIAAAIGLGVYFYKDYQHQQALKHPKFLSANGRLEANETYIAAKLKGRIEKMYKDEGDIVHKGDLVIQMQVNTLEADKAATIAKIKIAEGQVAMMKAKIKEAESVFAGAEKEFKRQAELLAKDAASQRTYDRAETEHNSAVASLEYNRASLLAAEGELDYEKASLERIQADINDSYLIAKYDGRIQYVLAREGEVLSEGGRAMNLVNLTAAYMTFFLPTEFAGKVKMGAEVKLVFDAAPDYAFPAKVTFIDPVAQFTPKSVETKVEREKLMFRIKAHITSDKLLEHLEYIKTGLPGMAYVKLDNDTDWTECPFTLPPDVNIPASVSAPQTPAAEPAAAPAAEPAAAPAAEPAAAPAAETVAAPAAAPEKK